MAKIKERFIRKFYDLIETLLYIMVPSPPGENFEEFYPLAIEKMGMMVGEMSKSTRKKLFFGLKIFNISPVLWGFGFNRFLTLNREFQKNYVDDWLHSQFWLKRYFLKSLKALIIMCFLDEPKISKYLGYDEKTHIENKILRRNKLLNQNTKP